MAKQKRAFYKKKRFIITASVITLLLILRLLLPTIVKNYVNKVLADIPGYCGEVEDIDLALFRGAYVIKGMYLNKVDATTEVPFLNFPKSDISIEWKSLWQGKIVSEIIMSDPEVIYVFEDQEQGSDEQQAESEDWSEALTDLVPIEINHFEVHRGKLAFVQLQAEPRIDLNIYNLELTADNLRNVRADERNLPSPIQASGQSIGQGNLTVEGRLNLIKKIPDMDISVSLDGVDATALNDFSKHYAGIDFKKGEFGLYGEIAIADAYLKGYMKTLLTDSKLIGKDDKFLETLWEGFVGFFKFLFKNQGTDTVATRIPIEGDLSDVKAGVWPTIGNIFVNAWFDAFEGVIDDDIEFRDAFQEEE